MKQWRVSGPKLREAREKACKGEGLSQANVERALALGASYISRLEQNNSNMTVDTVYRLATLFDCEVNDLVVEEEGDE